MEQGILYRGYHMKTQTRRSMFHAYSMGRADSLWPRPLRRIKLDRVK